MLKVKRMTFAALRCLDLAVVAQGALASLPERRGWRLEGASADEGDEAPPLSTG